MEGYLRAEFQGDAISLVNRYMPAEIQQWFHVRLPDAQLSAELRREGGELVVLLACEKYAQDVTLDILGADAYYSDNCFQMDAKERREIRIPVTSPDDFANRVLTVKAYNSARIVMDLNRCLY